MTTKTAFAGHASTTSACVGDGPKEFIKFQRICRYSSRRSKVVARRSSHLSVGDALKAVAAVRRQGSWVKRFVAYLSLKDFPSGLARYLAYRSYEKASEGIDDMTPEEWAQEELNALAS